MADFTMTLADAGKTALAAYLAKKIKKVEYQAGGTWRTAQKPEIEVSGAKVTAKCDTDITGTYPSGTTVTAVRLSDKSGNILVTGTGSMAVDKARTNLYLSITMQW